MHTAIGMEDITRILAQIFRETHLITEFMESPSIVVRQHLQGETDTDSPDSKGLIWDKVNTSKINVLHGFMTAEKEEDCYLFLINDLLDNKMLKEWGVT